jgi:hypothetical protein
VVNVPITILEVNTKVKIKSGVTANAIKEFSKLYGVESTLLDKESVTTRLILQQSYVVKIGNAGDRQRRQSDSNAEDDYYQDGEEESGVFDDAYSYEAAADEKSGGKGEMYTIVVAANIVVFDDERGLVKSGLQAAKPEESHKLAVVDALLATVVPLQGADQISDFEKPELDQITIYVDSFGVPVAEQTTAPPVTALGSTSSRARVGESTIAIVVVICAIVVLVLLALMIRSRNSHGITKYLTDEGLQNGDAVSTNATFERTNEKLWDSWGNGRESQLGAGHTHQSDGSAPLSGRRSPDDPPELVSWV